MALSRLADAVGGHPPDGPASAALVAEFFAARGVARGDIHGGLLTELYQALSPARTPPDWRFAPRLDAPRADRPTGPEVCAVIIETRPLPVLEQVIREFVDRLGIPVQLYYGPGNAAMIRASALSALAERGRLILSFLDAETLDAGRYNALLLSEAFWRSIAGRRKILFFQTDAILCPQSPHRLADFVGFDYVGATWGRRRPVGLTIDGGNGGLSLRDWTLCTQAIERFDPARWPGGEDGYFAFHVDLMGGRVATAADCARFATQSRFSAPSFGAHQISLLSAHERARFLDYCPEAARLLG